MATNGDMTFGNNIDVSKGVSGLVEGKITQKQFMNDYWKDNGYLSETIKELQQMKSSYLEMSNISKKMNQADRESIRKKLSELEVQLNLVTKIRDTQSVSYKKAIDSINSSNKLLEKGQKRYYELLGKAKDKEAGLTKSQLKALDQAITKYENILELSEEQREEFERIKKILEQAPNGFSQAISKTTKAIGKDVKDIVDTFNINKIANNTIVQFARDRINIMNDINKQLGFTSAGQFDTFKGTLNNTLDSMNRSMDNIFNSSDLTNYLQNLGQLGITNAEMAQQQMKSSIIANKYLGTSNETQELIFKYMKRTNNNDTLNNHNKMIVGLLKSQLGISREQLDVLSQQTYSDLDALSALGADEAGQKRYIKESTAVKSVVSAINPEWGTSLGNIFNEMLAMPYSQAMSKYGKIFGNDAKNAYNELVQGNAMNATKILMNSTFARNYMEKNSAAATSESAGAMGLDLGTYNMLKYFNNNSGKLMGDIQEAIVNIDETYGDDVDELVKNTTQLTAVDKIANWLDSFINRIDWKNLTNLANAAFGLYIASGVFNMFSKIKDIASVLGAGKVSTSIPGELSKFSDGKSAAGKGLNLLGTGAAVIGLTATTIAALGGYFKAKQSEAYQNQYGENLEALKGTEFEGNTSMASSNTMMSSTNSMGWLAQDFGGTVSGIGHLLSMTSKDKISRNVSLTEWMYNSGALKSSEAWTAWAILMDQLGSLDAINKKFGTNYSTGDLRKILESDPDKIFSNVKTLLDKGWHPYKDNSEGQIKSWEDYLSYWDSNASDGYHKNGLDWVPRDNYKARLHKGEMVLTAEEADVYRNIFGLGGESDSVPRAKGNIVTNLPWTMTAGWPSYPSGGQHRGLDFGIPIGTEVGATYSGKVITVERNMNGNGKAFGYGNYVRILGDNGRYFRFGHLSKPLVNEGDRVVPGTTIGLSGNTGNSTGPHVHYQVDSSADYKSDINPYPYVTDGLFRTTGMVSSIQTDSVVDSEGSVVKTDTRRLIPDTLSKGNNGQGGAEMITSSVDNGISKILTYLEGVRAEQSEQRKLINAFSKSRSAEFTF